MYLSIYTNLCETRKTHKPQYKKTSGLHRHHIKPKHSGGLDEESNYTYLTIREHVLAHFMLWKIYRNENDLRSMKMLGAKLSSQQRRIIGLFCRDNKIGVHGASKEQRKQWGTESFVNQMNGGPKEGSYVWWASPEGRKERAKLGGLASYKVNESFIYWASPEGRKERAKLGGLAHTGKIAVHLPNSNTFKRILQQDLQKYLDAGFLIGSGPSGRRGMKNKRPVESKRRKPVVADGVLYESIMVAALTHSVTSATIINRCKSKKHTNWYYA